jgi:hypothetical protein
VMAPSSTDASRMSYYLVDRGIDNDSDSQENDGRMYEFAGESNPPTATSTLTPAPMATPTHTPIPTATDISISPTSTTTPTATSTPVLSTSTSTPATTQAPIGTSTQTPSFTVTATPVLPATVNPTPTSEPIGESPALTATLYLPLIGK